MLWPESCGHEFLNQSNEGHVGAPRLTATDALNHGTSFRLIAQTTMCTCLDWNMYFDLFREFVYFDVDVKFEIMKRRPALLYAQRDMINHLIDYGSIYWQNPDLIIKENTGSGPDPMHNRIQERTGSESYLIKFSDFEKNSSPNILLLNTWLPQKTNDFS